MSLSYGSLQNLTYGNSTSPEPEVGMGATLIYWSDRHPATVIKVRSPTHIQIQMDKFTNLRPGVMSDSQAYSYSPDPNGSTYDVRKRKNGVWKTSAKQGNVTVVLGMREKYHDWSF